MKNRDKDAGKKAQPQEGNYEFSYFIFSCITRQVKSPASCTVIATAFNLNVDDVCYFQKSGSNLFN